MTSLLVLLGMRLLTTSHMFRIINISATACQLFNMNFVISEGAYKKFVRFFDTLGSFLTLIGLVLGLFSVFVDQYDLDFRPIGDLKDVVDHLKQFKEGMRLVQANLQKIIDGIDLNVTCEHIYSAVTTGLVASGFLSFIPGASSFASNGTKAAYYGIKVGESLTKLAKVLKETAQRLWGIQKIVRKTVGLSVSLTKTILKGSVATTVIKILMFLPPVYVGVHVLFAAFWPRRVLFFSKRQRNKFINDQFVSWFQITAGLILALAPLYFFLKCACLYITVDEAEVARVNRKFSTNQTFPITAQMGTFFRSNRCVAPRSYIRSLCAG